MRYDTLIVGAGFAGSTLAERLASQGGHRVLVLDRRMHVGGNAYDERDAHGILVHRYGPHIFHTNSQDVFAYLSRFTAWRPYEHRVLTSVDGKLLAMPINLDTVNSYFGLTLTSQEMERYLADLSEPVAMVRTSEDVVVSRVGRELYEKFFQGYTRKQWGLDPSELDASVTARVPTRTSTDDRYFTDKFQAMPLHGYTALFERMLDCPGVTVMLGVDFRELGSAIRYDQLVFTGPIDQYFDYCYGSLSYRSLRFEHKTLRRERFQGVAVVNYPNDHAYTRITEYKHLTGQRHAHTSISYEYAQAEGEPYYPTPRPANAQLYARYKMRADVLPNVHFVGRLATYKYYNMDQVVAQALATYARMQGTRSWIPA